MRYIKGNLSNLYIFPTCGTTFYVHNNGKWKKAYEEILSKKEKRRIFNAFKKVLGKFDFVPRAGIHGKQIEDRKTQITFSARGQKAPLELKKSWDPRQSKRRILIKELKKLIPEFEIGIGGTTSIDITRKGIDKAYGIRKIEEHLGIKKEEMLFVGDALYKGGNDYPVRKTGVKCIQVADEKEAEKLIRKMLVEF